MNTADAQALQDAVDTAVSENRAAGHPEAPAGDRAAQILEERGHPRLAARIRAALARQRAR